MTTLLLNHAGGTNNFNYTITNQTATSNDLKKSYDDIDFKLLKSIEVDNTPALYSLYY
jgi:hypothetical protein